MPRQAVPLGLLPSLLYFLCLLFLTTTRTQTEAVQISVLSSSSIRGHAFPLYTPTSINACYTEEFDDKDCLGGCSRRIALTQALRDKDPNLYVVDTGGVFFGTLLYTLYGTEPFERCMEEIDYDVISLGGSDLYVGLEAARIFFMSIAQQTIQISPSNDAVSGTASHSSPDIYSQSIKLPNMMHAESFLHDHQLSLKLRDDEDGKKLHDQLEKQFSAADPASLQDRLVHQIQALTFPSLEEQTFSENSSSQQAQLRPNQRPTGRKPFNPKKSDRKSARHTPSNSTTQAFQTLDALQTPQSTSPQHDLAPLQSRQQLQQQTAPLKRSRDAQVISTNLNVTVSSWKLIMRTSAILNLKGDNTGRQVVFLSMLPDWYRSSITNCPPWFQIGQGYRSVNHIRAEIARLQRLDVGKKIIAFILLVQEDTNASIYDELYQIEHINIFITPVAKGDHGAKQEVNIYGQRVIRAQYKPDHHVQHLVVDVADDGSASLTSWKQINLDASIIEEYQLQEPKFFAELRDVYNPSDESTVFQSLARPLSHVYGEQYLGDIQDEKTGWTHDTYGCRSATCPMGLLAASSLLAASNSASIAILNSGAIRGSWAGGSNEEKITLADILRVFPFFNKLVSLDVTGATIHRILAHSISSGLSSRFVQTNLRWVYFPYYKDQGPSLEDALSHIMDVSLLRQDGTFEQIDLKKTYRVVTVSYIYEGNDGFDRVLTPQTMSNMVFHSDTLLTSIVNHLRKSKFVWAISQEAMADCLLNRSLVPLPLADSNCLMAFTNVTASQYRPCPTQYQWCSDNSPKDQFFVQRVSDSSPSQPQFDTQQDLSAQNASKTDYTIEYDPNTPHLHYSTIDYYTQTYFPQRYEQEQSIERARRQQNAFYTQIPSIDQARMLSAQQIPSSMFPKRYTTANTGWADELILSGQIQFLNPELGLFTTAADVPQDIELIPGISHDPEMPKFEDCTSCSGYGTCISEGVCECTLGNENDDSEPTLLLGKPTAGLYQGIEMISGVSCSQVLTRYVRSTFTLFLINAIAIVTLLLSIGGFVFIICFRKHPVIRSSGFDMLLTVAIGGAIVAMGIALLIYSPFSEVQRTYLKHQAETNKAISFGFATRLRLVFGPITMCNLTLSLTLIGFITMFGAILAKSYRIHTIFNARTLHEIRTFSNNRARYLLGLFILLQIVLLLIIYFISPMDAVATKGDGQFWVDCNIPDMRYKAPSAEARAGGSWHLTPRLVTYIFLLLYNFLVLCLGIYLSLVTRNVDKSYNESTVLAISVYNIVLCAIVFFVALSSNNPTFSKLLQVAILAYGVVSTLLLMLGPKIKIVWQSRRADEQAHESKVFFYDPMTLRIQALEREQKIESQGLLEKTITTQQAHLGTLIQHILLSKDELASLADSTSSTTSTTDKGNNRDDDDDDGDDGEGAHPKESQPLTSHNKQPRSTTYCISEEVQAIIAQYQPQPPPPSPIVAGKGSLNHSISNLSQTSLSQLSMTESTASSEQDQRRSRLMSTFGHMSKTNNKTRPHPAPTNTNPLLTPMNTNSSIDTSTSTAGTNLDDLDPAPSSSASSGNTHSVLL